MSDEELSPPSEEPFVSEHHDPTSREFDAVLRDLKALRDDMVEDREAVFAELHRTRQDVANTFERQAGSMLTLHRLAREDAAARDQTRQVFEREVRGFILEQQKANDFTKAQLARLVEIPGQETLADRVIRWVSQRASRFTGMHPTNARLVVVVVVFTTVACILTACATRMLTPTIDSPDGGRLSSHTSQ